ncbi:MAG TPA: hypothetical protein PKZ01_13965 [Candidatus Hydrogenedentes bacterium]|nr:hypothetical protein [Candidatus Hydrogenedentota bacterium]
MAKKERIVIKRDDGLLDIDTELDSALSALETTNRKIDELLQAIEVEGSSMGKGAEMDENGEIVESAAQPSPADHESAASTQA